MQSNSTDLSHSLSLYIYIYIIIAHTSKDIFHDSPTKKIPMAKGFGTLTANIRRRRGAPVAIQVPLFRDQRRQGGLRRSRRPRWEMLGKSWENHRTKWWIFTGLKWWYVPRHQGPRSSQEPKWHGEVLTMLKEVFGKPCLSTKKRYLWICHYQFLEDSCRWRNTHF